MKTKRLLRFYFCAESLDKAFDNIILSRACASAGSAREGGKIAEELCALIEKRRELAGLWEYLDGVAAELAEEELQALERYARSRRPLRSLDGDIYKRIRNATAKFTRKCSLIVRYPAALKLVDEYFALLT